MTVRSAAGEGRARSAAAPAATRMRVLEVGEPFGLESLRFAARPVPAPGPRDLLIRLTALSLNYRDLLVMRGVDRWRPAVRRVPVSDGVGVVVDRGRQARHFAVGDRVVPIFYPNWRDAEPTAGKLAGALGGASTDGLAAEYAVVPEEAAVAPPPGLSDEEAATLPCAGVTAWNAVMGAGPPETAETVVVLGTGGVALFALQFATTFGARVIITSRSGAKLARAVARGAVAGIDTQTTPDWPRVVRDLTAGRGADLVVDTVGDLAPAVEAVRIGGTVAFVGLLRGTRCELDLVRLMGRSATIRAIDVGSREMFEAMNQAIARARLRPVIDRVFPFARAVDAYAYLADARQVGKVCMRLREE